MGLIIKNNVVTFLLICTLFLISFPSAGVSSQINSDKNKNQRQEELRKLSLIIEQTVQSKNFDILQHSINRNDTLFWAQCNTDIGDDLTFNNLADELKKNSDNAKITVAGHGLNIIETEGWTGEYPYLYFYFSKVTGTEKWKWVGVCYAPLRSLDYRLAIGEKDKYYDVSPKLPRQGARVFEDELALQYRIVEILKFKKLDALKPYATRNKIFVGKSCPATLNGDELIKTGVPVGQAVEFLKKNSIGSKELVPKAYKTRFFRTSGWTGEKAEITFCFAESNERWEWIGIAY